MSYAEGPAPHVLVQGFVVVTVVCSGLRIAHVIVAGTAVRVRSLAVEVIVVVRLMAEAFVKVGRNGQRGIRK